MKFTVDGGGRLQRNAAPAWVEKAIATLDSLPDGTLLTPHALAERTDVGLDRMRHMACHPKLFTYRFKPNYNRLYFGNSKTITAAHKAINNDSL